MNRSIVILPENFSGPWSFGFANPMTVYLVDGSRKLAVLVTEPNITIPLEGTVYAVGSLDTLNSVLTRAGFSRTPPSPPAPVVISPPEIVPEPSVVPPPPAVIPEPVILPPVVEPPSFFGRVKKFFRK